MKKRPSILDRLHALPKRKIAKWAAVGYVAVVIGGAFLGAEIALRSKTRWVKGTFVPVGRRGNSVFLPASPETLSRGVIGMVPIKPNRGHALLGEAKVVGTLVRREILRERGRIPDGSVAWASTFVYNGTPSQLGVEFENTSVATDVGNMPAWFIPQLHGAAASERGDAIAIVIHGHGGQRAQALRMLPTLMDSGVASLFVTFRNAYGAPRIGKGYLTLGDQEADDVLHALDWAKERGFKRAILYGFSMGGNIALCAAQRQDRWPLPVTGVILDCPALEWRDVMYSQGERYGLPRFLAGPVARLTELIVTRRSGQNFDTVDQLAAAPKFTLPMLLFHGTRDRTIPVRQSDRLAELRPDLVEYHRVEGAKHIRCWNISPKQYDEALLRFIEKVLPGVKRD
ncbi:alpha/beta fold hydrolase [Deinococcus cavernae]|uniref:Alpha/beta fold hydrolase n=1 Tax=Deinococcus cavernae TaxID=2320857 RepID=A0A418V5P1_9DEIO|nr:alpha/beta fold hydrolase [Deinococcus cavernae]RJF71325.1 alpha/beta fold hydrolase [Deinococcus cavernae]